MDWLQGFVVITMVHLLAAASPGPDFILVSQQTLREGRKTGFLCSLGITLGLSIHIIYSALGLAALIANSSFALSVIKLLGGTYLICLGWQSLKLRAHSPQDPALTHTTIEPTPRTPDWLGSISKGFLCNVFNPKAPIYFVSVFTLVLSPDIPAYQLVLLGLWMMCLQMAWFSSLVLLLSHGTVQRLLYETGHWIDRLLGGVLMLLGLKLLLDRG